MQAEPTALVCGTRAWARAELLPWDREAFGFPVGRLLPGQEVPRDDELAMAEASLQAWSQEQGVALLAAMVPAASVDWMQFLPRLGFRCIDLSLSVNLVRLSHRPRTIRPAPIRTALPEDHASIQAIAGSAFEFGRYHRDPQFPRELADRRFARWVEKALARPASGQRFLVTGPAGAPTGFMFLTLQEDRADWHLAAVSRAGPAVPGPALFAGVLEVMEQEGVRQVTSKISAANTGVLNIYAAFGFRFIEPEFTYHTIYEGQLDFRLARHSLLSPATTPRQSTARSGRHPAAGRRVRRGWRPPRCADP